tara:strand:- start:267 stop:800 length:534 start_codon:yes stop_codon:yes gene_type:complete
MISNFLKVVDLSKYNDVCLDVIRESEVGNYSFIKGDSSYDTNKQFLFTTKLIPLAKEIQLNIKNYTEEFTIEPSLMSSSWFNILYKGGVVEKHQHAKSWDDEKGSVISGAYYPYVDENSCPLIFENEDENYESIPTSGMMVMFPSWLSHYTKPNQSNKRITVSFNTIRKEVYLERSK